jgi:hypothetical protein
MARLLINVYAAPANVRQRLPSARSRPRPLRDPRLLFASYFSEFVGHGYA